MKVFCVVDIDRSQKGKDIGLDRTDQQLEPAHPDDEYEAQRRDGSACSRACIEALDDEVAEAIEDVSDTPEVAVQKKDTSGVLRKCIEKLTPEHREIIDLVYYHEKSVEEVAEIVGIPENTVKTRMFYARKKLAESLKAAGIERGWP